MRKTKKLPKMKLSVEFNCRFIFDADLNHWICHMDGNSAHGIGETLPNALTDLLANINNRGLKNFIVERQLENSH